MSGAACRLCADDGGRFSFVTHTVSRSIRLTAWKLTGHTAALRFYWPLWKTLIPFSSAPARCRLRIGCELRKRSSRTQRASNRLTKPRSAGAGWPRGRSPRAKKTGRRSIHPHCKRKRPGEACSEADMPTECVINADSLHTVPKDRLRERITTLNADKQFALSNVLRYTLDLEC